MKLNLQVIKEELPEKVDDFNWENQDYGTLSGVSIWSDGETLIKNYVYIITGKTFDQNKSISRRHAYIIIGETKKKITGVSYLRIDEEFDPIQILNHVQCIFEKYANWSQTLLLELNRKAPLKKIGRIIYRFIQLPFMMCNAGNYVVINEYDPSNSESCAMYGVYSDKRHAYDELTVIYSDPIFQKNLYTKDTFLFPAGIWKYDYLCRYIYNTQGNKVGILIIGEDYRPFRSSDRLIISYLSDILRIPAEQNNNALYPTSYTFDDMIKHLIQEGKEYKADYDRILYAKGWAPNHSFTVYLIKPCMDSANVYTLLNMIVFGDIFQSPYVTIHEKELLLILNDHLEQKTLTSSLNQLEHFMRDAGFKGAISVSSQGFSKIRLHYLQARAIIDYNLLDSKKCFTFYDSVLLPVMLHSLKEQYPPEFYMTKEFLQELKTYKNENGQLLQTLKAFFENDCNASQTARAMHIHLSTFKYRLNKLEENLHMDLKDHKNQAYLYFLLLMSNIH